jgi:predicted alpha/beta-fold hydrolase
LKTLFACKKRENFFIIFRKEAIPIDLLYLNPNIITILTSHGGHIEYLNGMKQEWWAFKLVLDYFSYFENQCKMN